MIQNSELQIKLTHPVTAETLTVTTRLNAPGWDLYDRCGYITSLPFGKSEPETLFATHRLTVQTWRERGMRGVSVEDHASGVHVTAYGVSENKTRRAAFDLWRVELHRRYWQVKAKRRLSERIFGHEPYHAKASVSGD